MTVYYCAYALIGGMFLLVNRSRLDHRHKQYVQAGFSFLLVFLLLALRHPSMGIDLKYGVEGTGYIWSFHTLSEKPWSEILTMSGHLNYERGYIILNKLVGSVFSSHQIFLGIVAFISVAPMYLLIAKKSVSATFSAIVYMGLPGFMLLFSGLRQCIAIGICLLSLLFVEKRKPIPFCLLVLLAFTFHSTAALFLVVYPLYHLQLSRRVRALSMLIPPAIYVLKEPLLLLAARLVGKQVTLDYNNAINLFLIYMAIYFLLSLYAREEHQGLLNIFFIACCIQAMGGIHLSLTRAGYYFTPALALLLPAVLGTIEDKKTRLLFSAGLFAFFVFFGLRSLAGTTWAMANPYIPFWTGGAA